MFGMDEGGQATASAGANAGPSAPLRMTDVLGWMEEDRQRQVQVPMQVLRLRCASLRMTDVLGWMEEDRQRQVQVPMQVLRLRCASLRMTDVWVGWRRAGNGKCRCRCRCFGSAQDDRCFELDGGGQATASAGADAGPSASLRMTDVLGWMEEDRQRQVQVPMQVLRLRSG